MIKIGFYYIICFFVVIVVKIKQKERKNNADTLYEVVCLESESERERRKTTASPSARLPQSGSQSSMIPSPPEDDEDEGKCKRLCGGWRAVHTAATPSLWGWWWDLGLQLIQWALVRLSHKQATKHHLPGAPFRWLSLLFTVLNKYFCGC